MCARPSLKVLSKSVSGQAGETTMGQRKPSSELTRRRSWYVVSWSPSVRERALFVSLDYPPKK